MFCETGCPEIILRLKIKISRSSVIGPQNYHSFDNPAQSNPIQFTCNREQFVLYLDDHIIHCHLSYVLQLCWLCVRKVSSL